MRARVQFTSFHSRKTSWRIATARHKVVGGGGRGTAERKGMMEMKKKKKKVSPVEATNGEGFGAILGRDNFGPVFDDPLVRPAHVIHGLVHRRRLWTVHRHCGAGGRWGCKVFTVSASFFFCLQPEKKGKENMGYKYCTPLAARCATGHHRVARKIQGETLTVHGFWTFCGRVCHDLL